MSVRRTRPLRARRFFDAQGQCVVGMEQLDLIRSPMTVRECLAGGVDGIRPRVESQGIPVPDESFMEIAHCTVTRNTGGGIFLAAPQNVNQYDPAVRIRSTVSYGNFAPSGSVTSVEKDLFGPVASYTSTQIRYSNIFRATPAPIGAPPPVWPGVGNISTDPLFLSVANDNYRLSATSPCIDAGEDTSIQPLSPPPMGMNNFGDPELGDIADLDEDDNTAEYLVFDLDRGAREADAPAVVDTGLAAALPGISDMGCFEYRP